jgi:histidinol-phosphate aminotransferase
MSRPEPRQGIRDMTAHMRGLSSVEGHERIIKLSSNENPFGPSPLAVAAALAELDTMHLYPEAGQTALRDALGQRFNLDPAGIFCGAGSDQVLAMLVQAYTQPGDEVLFSANGFAKFKLYAMSVGAVPVAVADRDFLADVDAILASVNDRTRLVALANPDNPTSTCLSGTELRRLHAALPDNVLLVIDAAYADYVRIADYEPGSGLVNQAENVVMSRTFSKIFALAAMRVGWVYAPAHIIDVLKRLEPSFPLTAAGMAAAIAALDDTEHTLRSQKHNDLWRARFSESLRDLRLHVYPSQTNFVMARFPDNAGRSAEAADAHLLSRGIIARRFLAPAFEACLRITIGTADEITATTNALNEFLAR